MPRVHRSDWWSRLRDDYNTVVHGRWLRVVALWGWLLLLLVLLALNIYSLSTGQGGAGAFGAACIVVAVGATRSALSSWARIAAMRSRARAAAVLRHPSVRGRHE